MIDLEFLQKLIRTLDKSGIDHIEIQRGGTRIRVSKSPMPAMGGWGEEQTAPSREAAVPQGEAAPTVPSSHPPGTTPPAAPRPLPDNVVEITSPMVGTFYRAASPEAPPFAEVGKRIEKGDPLCIIEAMKLMNELESEIDGVVREVCVSNGEPVEYGQPLFRVERG